MKKSKILIEKASLSVHEFKERYQKLKRSVELAGKSQSTPTNYSRCLTHMGLHFKAPAQPQDQRCGH